MDPQLLDVLTKLGMALDNLANVNAQAGTRVDTRLQTLNHYLESVAKNANFATGKIWLEHTEAYTVPGYQVVWSYIRRAVVWFFRGGLTPTSVVAK